MQLSAICVARNEADILAQTLAHAATFCDRVYVIDNDSSDESWAIVCAMSAQDPRIVPFARIPGPFHDGMRAIVYNAVHRQRDSDDWWLVLDADELLAEAPAVVIATAQAQEADVIWTWQVQFYFTERDLAEWEGGRDTRDLPITSRRRFYAINWQEPRLFRNRPERPWDATISAKVPDGLRRRCSRRILNRHYQFRDPPQIAARIGERLGHPTFARHVRSADWHAYLREAATLTEHVDGAAYRFRQRDIINYYRRWYLRKLRWFVRRSWPGRGA